MSPSEFRTVDAVIFDMGNVLIDWTPARLVQHFTDDDSVVEHVTEQVVSQCSRGKRSIRV
jgi:FMN phosphatase YigB (HAD superfamily)